MTDEVRERILFLSTLIFEKEEYEKVEEMLNQKIFNELRLFISRKMDIWEALLVLDKKNEELVLKIDDCSKLEDQILEVYIENLNIHG